MKRKRNERRTRLPSVVIATFLQLACANERRETMAAAEAGVPSDGKAGHGAASADEVKEKPTVVDAAHRGATADASTGGGETDRATETPSGSSENAPSTTHKTEPVADVATTGRDDYSPAGDAGMAAAPASGSDAATLHDAGNDAGSTTGGEAIELALDGPRTLAPGGIGLFRLLPDKLTDLGAVDFGGIPISAEDGERVQFVLTHPELDHTPENSTSVDLESLEVMLPLNRATLGSLSQEAARLLRVAVRAPTTLATGVQSVVLTTTHGEVYTWHVEIVDDAVPYVLPTPAGILWPAISSHQGVFPIGTSGPYFPLVDPISIPSYPRPDPDGEVSYDFRLATPEGEMCTPAAPTQGLISGAEIIAGVGESPIHGYYDLEYGNFIEVSVDRTSIGGTTELYRGGWVTGTLAAVQNPATRGQLPPPAPGHAFVSLRSVRTGLPLVFNYVAVSTAPAEACPDLGVSAD